MVTTQTLIENLREKRGLEIANKNRQIKRIDDSNYEVLSQSGNSSYLVSRTEDNWICECPDHRFRKVKCKHAWAVEFSLKLKEQVRKNTVIQQVTISKCLFWHSPKIKKYGIRRNKSGDIQRFLCGNCG